MIVHPDRPTVLPFCPEAITRKDGSSKTLKNQGYHLEHNYGHGKQHLSTVFAYLVMLAFLLDQVQEACCRYFQAARDRYYHRRQALWDKMRGWFHTLILSDWETFFSALIWEPTRQAPVWNDSG